MIDEKQYLVIVGGMPQTNKVQVISLRNSDPVPRCLSQINDHPQLMEWSAVFGGIGKWPSPFS